MIDKLISGFYVLNEIASDEPDKIIFVGTKVHEKVSNNRNNLRQDFLVISTFLVQFHNNLNILVNKCAF